jgi:4-amino-4-deoxy-L-arabinose transferase-like glycosyltransferase
LAALAWGRDCFLGRLVSSAPSTPSPDAPAASWGRDLLLLALAFTALYALKLGAPALANPDEGRYAEIPREMVASGDWVTPRLNGVNYFEKPPLLYWAVAAGLVCFGPGEASLRIMPVVCGVGGVLLTYAAARRLFGRAAGLGAAVVLGTTAFYAALSRLLILDMGLSVLMSATLFCFLLGVREAPGARRRWLFYGLYASAALATLTKGPIGFLVTGAVMALWLLVCNQWHRLRPFYLPSGGLLFLAIAVPWHVLVAARNPTWAHFYLVNQNWERFTTQEHGRFHPWYWFIPILAGGLFPWIGFLWPALRTAAAGGWARRRETAQADRWYFVIWAAFIFIFFSKSQSKLPPYILPVFPALAVLIGLAVGQAWEERELGGSRIGVKLFAVLSALLAVAVLLAVSLPERFGIDWYQARELHRYAYAMAAVLDGGALVGLWASRRSGQARPGLIVVTVTMALFFAVTEFASPLFYPPGTKPLAEWVRAHGRPGDRIFHYARFFHDFMFYSGRLVGTVGFHGDEIELENDPVAVASGRFIEKGDFLKAWAGPGRVLVVARKTDAETVALVADPAFHYRLLAQTRDYTLLSNEP